MSATASAELDDSPEPTGTVVSTCRSAGATATPRSTRARTTPATKRPHGGSNVDGSVVPSTAWTDPVSCSDTGTSRQAFSHY